MSPLQDHILLVHLHLRQSLKSFNLLELIRLTITQPNMNMRVLAGFKSATNYAGHMKSSKYSFDVAIKHYNGAHLH